MRTCVFDLETFGLSANLGLLLCCSYKEFGHGKVKTIRADRFPNWEKDRANVKPICEKVIEELEPFDIFVGHNGQYFDKKMIVSWAMRYRLRLFLRFAKFFDPCLASRKHLRLSRNDLGTLADFLGIRVHKTPIHWDNWRESAFNGNRKAMDKICYHCEKDVEVLEQVHGRMSKLSRDISERGF